jgi:hypothetical protein
MLRFTGMLVLSCASRSFLCRLSVLPFSSAATRFRFLWPAFSSTLAALQILDFSVNGEIVPDVDLAFSLSVEGWHNGKIYAL